MLLNKNIEKVTKNKKISTKFDSADLMNSVYCGTYPKEIYHYENFQDELEYIQENFNIVDFRVPIGCESWISPTFCITSYPDTGLPTNPRFIVTKKKEERKYNHSHFLINDILNSHYIFPDGSTVKATEVYFGKSDYLIPIFNDVCEKHDMEIVDFRVPDDNEYWIGSHLYICSNVDTHLMVDSPRFIVKPKQKNESPKSTEPKNNDYFYTVTYTPEMVYNKKTISLNPDSKLTLMEEIIKYVDSRGFVLDKFTTISSSELENAKDLYWLTNFGTIERVTSAIIPISEPRFILKKKTTIEVKLKFSRRGQPKSGEFYQGTDGKIIQFVGYTNYIPADVDIYVFEEKNNESSIFN